MIACGAWLKSSACVTLGDQAYVSSPLGDLEHADTCRLLEQTVMRLCTDLAIRPAAVAHDLHPDFFSTRLAVELAASHSIPAVAVQHHHAHIAAICAEHRIDGPVLGLALDGVGLGTDGHAWGGELLRVQGAVCKRLGHLTPLPLPGGDRAAREPWRMAAAALFRLEHSEGIAARFPGQPAAAIVTSMLQRKWNTPPSSSMGRLFDAAAGLLGVCEVQSDAAEAAIRLETMATAYGEVAPLPGGYRIDAENRLDFLPLLAMLADCDRPGYGAALFHHTLVAALTEWVVRTANACGLDRVACGGGCFYNAILSRSLSDSLATNGLRPLTAQRMPPDDSAIALGQAWVALQRLA